MPSSVVLFSYLFLLLMAYSFLGWCGEMVYCSLGQGKLCEKRGFLNGPLCPIYGHGALLVLTALGGSANPLGTFTAGAGLTSAVEYVTSYLMEKLFHMRWWDYSHKRWNLNGRVCLQNSTIFGLACVALCHWANPAVTLRVGALLRRGIGVPLALSLLVLYLADVVLSVRSAIQIGSRLEQLHAIHDELAAKLEALRQEQRLAAEAQRAKLEAAMGAVRQGAAEKRAEAARAVQAKLEPLGGIGGEFAKRLDAARAEAQQKLHALYDKQDFFERRLLRAFPTLHSPLHGEALKKLREYWEKREE